MIDHGQKANRERQAGTIFEGHDIGLFEICNNLPYTEAALIQGAAEFLDDLAQICGKDPLPRSQVVSKVWDHIRKNNLQNPQNKREIVADGQPVQVHDGVGVHENEPIGVQRRTGAVGAIDHHRQPL